MREISLVLAHDVQSYNNSETGLTLSLYRYHFISRETYALIQLPPHPFLLIPTVLLGLTQKHQNH